MCTVLSASDPSTLTFGCQARMDKELVSRLQVGVMSFLLGGRHGGCVKCSPLLIFVVSSALMSPWHLHLCYSVVWRIFVVVSGWFLLSVSFVVHVEW